MRVAVIGSGIVGAAAGYELARAGVDVVLVDSLIPGRATSAGAGIICPWSSRVDDPDWYRFAVAGAEHYRGLLAALAADGETELGHRRVGSLRLVSEDEAEEAFRCVAERAAESPMAGEIELISARRARELFPPLEHDGAAIHIPGAARLDGRLVRDAMRRAAVRHGARVVNGTAAIVADSAVRGVRVDDVFIEADAVIAAAGAWSPQLLEPIGVQVRVVPQRGQITHLRLPGVDTANWPVVLPRSRHYLLAFDDSRVVVGATREDDAGFDHRVTAAGMAEVLGEALSVAPGLAGATHVETRIGFRPMGPDIRPLLGPIPQVAGLVVANGLGASGLTMGPYAGSVAARLARQVDPGIDLAPYDPLR
ncbi:D-amino-acid dehydrogenase [Saccharopolyspora kobensis]|uniref:D-amino-acid dehydrogenase n=1 Tax=Saccharopolyspora kobensis TaxID=146035 RepID=A0A1H6A9E5_9PSEU|nr:FAD-dependent oxidoreductase [Saccharopolyspora kobensis]SEG44677.1 D-amino-acid dehydrogenase [Saccharopolyspora kobensis]SFE52004.1 D-amino-acid dehydrogenase [Saccharopolyspora kobensis]